MAAEAVRTGHVSSPHVVPSCRASCTCLITPSLPVTQTNPPGSVIRDHGLIEIQPDARTPSGDGVATAGASAVGGSANNAVASSLLVNVNNRLVSPALPFHRLNTVAGLLLALRHPPERPAPGFRARGSGS